MGSRRGLAQLLANGKKPQACIVADALLVAAIGSAIGMAILIVFPKAMYPTTPVGGLDRLLAITVLAISWTDIALAALAYHNDVGSTVRARSIVQPWIISIAAFALSFVPIMVTRGDGLIIAYVLSMVAALVAALIPLLRCYGLPHGWTPDLQTAWTTAARNVPLAAADTVEWASRRIDLAVLGAFLPAVYVGIYYAAQQVATLAGQAQDQLRAGARAGDRPADRRRRPCRHRQAGAPGHLLDHRRTARDRAGARHSGARGDGAGRIGIHRRHGDAGFLLAAEVIAAIAVVSEAALIYIARKRNMVISLVMLALEAGLAAALILIMRNEGLPLAFQATGPGDRPCAWRWHSPRSPSRGCSPASSASAVSGWRWDLAWATAAGVAVGALVRLFLPQTWQLVIGVPAILVAFGAVLWTKGFGPEDRELFRMRKEEVRELRDAEDAALARDQVADDIV